MDRYLEDEQYQVRVHEQGYTQYDMEECDSIAHEKWIYVASSDERACYRGQYKVVQPYQGGGSDTMKTEEHPEYKQFYTVVKCENITRQSSVPDAEQWSSWSSWSSQTWRE